MALGKNTPDGAKLTGYIQEIERIRDEKKQLGEDEKMIFASAKAAGFTPVTIRDVLKIRRMKPADRQEAEARLETYLHAIGMDAEAPLFRRVGLMGVDRAAKAEVIEALKLLVPDAGEIVITVGGQKVKLWRDRRKAKLTPRMSSICPSRRVRRSVQRRLLAKGRPHRIARKARHSSLVDRQAGRTSR